MITLNLEVNGRAPVGRRRPGHAAALRAARRPAAERREVRLRPRPVRRMHGDRRRRARCFRASCRSRLVGSRAVTTVEGLGTRGNARSRCSRRSSTSRRRNAAIASPGMMMRAQALLERNAAPERRGDPARTWPQPLPLRHPHAHPARGAARGLALAASVRSGASMTAPVDRAVAPRACSPPAARWSCPSRCAPRRSRAGQPQAARPESAAAGQPQDASRCSTAGSASTRRARHRVHRQGRARAGHQDRADPGRGRATAGRSARAITIVTADTERTAERGLHGRQPFDAGQRHRDPARGRTGARDPRSSAPRDDSASRRTSCCGRATAWSSAGGASCALRRARRRRGCCTCAPRRNAPLRDPAHAHRDRASRATRVDIPAKVTGGPPTCRTCGSTAWCMRASCGRRARRDAACARYAAPSSSMPGVLKVVRDGRFIGVVARARMAGGHGACARSAAAARWDEQRDPAAARPRCTRPCARRRREDSVIARPRRAARRAATSVERDLPAAVPAARVDRPVVRGGAARRTASYTVWTPCAGRVSAAQGASPSCWRCRRTQVRCIHVEGSGCYGHNGADDVAGRCGAARARAARPAGARAMDARGRARLGAVRPADGGASRSATLDAVGQRSSTGTTRSGATRIRRGRARRGDLLAGTLLEHAVPADAAASRCRSPKAAATATRSRSTRCPTRASSTISCPRCRCACRRCARSART